MNRHELSSEQWELIESSLRRPAPTGRPPKDRRVMLNGILWILRTGAPWRDLPERFGAWRTVYGYFQVRYLAPGLHVVREIDDSQYPDYGGAAESEPPAPGEHEPRRQPNSTHSGDEIDLTVLYTDHARADAGGTDAIRAITSADNALTPWSGQMGLIHGPSDCLRLEPEGLRGRMAS